MLKKQNKKTVKLEKKKMWGHLDPKTQWMGVNGERENSGDRVWKVSKKN